MHKHVSNMHSSFQPECLNTEKLENTENNSDIDENSSKFGSFSGKPIEKKTATKKTRYLTLNPFVMPIQK